MNCTTCNGKGLLFNAEPIDGQYTMLPRPCPDCHAGCQHCGDGDTMPVPPTYEDDGFETIHPQIGRE